MRRALAVCALALVLAGCGGGAHRATPKNAPAGVATLRSVDQLRSAFNAHPGVPRLIVLVSPT